MLTRLARIVGGVAGAAMSLSLVTSALQPASVAAETKLALPWYARLVEGADSQTWEQKPASLKSGPVSVVVHLSKSPLAIASKGMSAQQRVDYAKQISAEQDALAAQITSLGGTVTGRFKNLSTGLTATIDSSKLDAVRGFSGVIAIRATTDYRLDLTETVPFIGGTAVQNLGITGKGVNVAVIDSGIDYTHSKLGGPGTEEAYADAYCGNPNATPNPADPSCNANASTDTSGLFPNSKVAGGYDWVGEKWPRATGDTVINPDDNPIDFEGHGTHVADIIGGFESAPGANDKGVAPGSSIWAFKACSAVASSCNGTALLLSVDDAMDLDDDPATYDPADVVNMSLGSPYGQPEDDLTLFVDMASYYGSLMVVSAGNSGDIPYIVGSPSTASGAVSVAQSTVPSDSVYPITAGTVTALGVLQPWSPTPSGPISGVLQYGNGAGGNTLGCSSFPAGSLAGKILLVDRGTCAVSIKAANGSQAGAVAVIIANNAFSNTPPSFSYGGGTVIAPAFTVTQNDGAALKTQLGQVANIGSPSPLRDDIVASSARGPRIADGDIKPDIAAPGASVSAEVGTGTDKTAFGGTSGAAPMVSGSAALIVEALEKRGVLDTASGLDGETHSSKAPLVKSILMNTAKTDTYIGGKFLAPITLQGAGRVDVLNAYNTQTTAWDVTDLNKYVASGTQGACVVTPGTDLFLYFYGINPECAQYPFGNEFFNAWNAQTGSLSFGYDGVAKTTTEARDVLIANTGTSSKTYKLSSSFRYNDDKSKGVTLSVSPSSVTIPANSSKQVKVTLKVDAKGLRDWTLNAGQFGAAGTNIFCNDTNPQNGCPTLTIFEYDGFVKIDGGSNNVVNLPWEVLPKKAAQTYVKSKSGSSVKLSNPAPYKPGDADVFSLVDVSPNECEIVDGNGDCLDENYVPGILPGSNSSPIDLKEVGLRSYQVSGLNAALGLPAAPSGAINDEVIDFALSVYDAPFRASHNYPVEFDVYIDANSDGTDDYVVFNADRTQNAADGRNTVFVLNLRTGVVRPYFYSATNFNSQNWVLPVPSAAVGVKSNQPFKFQVLAIDAYFTGTVWDQSPFDGSYHTYQTGLPKYRPVTTAFQVAKNNGSYTLNYSKPSGGATASPSQKGLLFFYRDAEVGKESEATTLP